jgi:hypothetical protein
VRVQLVDGAFKRTKCGKWCHLACALWQRDVRFEDAESMEPIVLDSLRQASVRKCFVCRRSGYGVVKCVGDGCQNWMHVTCGRTVGCLLNLALNFAKREVPRPRCRMPC